MNSILRYGRLFHVQLRTSALLALQYRADFLIDGLVSLMWSVTTLVPLFVVFNMRQRIGGWTFGEALLVVGWFTLLDGILEGAISPSLTAVVEYIRKGTLDFVLLKPADAQFLVSTSRFQIWRITNIITALCIFTYAFYKLGRWPALSGILTALVMLFSSTLLLYSIWILVICAAFYVVRIDNLSHLFASIFDAARWPITVFRGWVRWLFTLVIPLALMTTYPAQALAGTLKPITFILSLTGSFAFAVIARLIWLRSLKNYTSASS